MKSSVPTNSFQQVLHGQQNENARPQSGTVNRTTCEILQIYDKEYMSNGEAPLKIRKQIENFPGLIFARVLIGNGKSIFVALGESEDQVYSTYGNSRALEGRMGVLEFPNSDLTLAKLYPQRTWAEESVDTNLVTATFDIGAVV